MGAAGELLAEGRTEVSIQEITERAGVGFGSFHNHFDSKAQLFEAAVETALMAHADLLEIVSAGIEDPAERFAVGMRTTCRMQRDVPQMADVVLSAGTRMLHLPTGIGPRARDDIAAGVAAGRFDVADHDLAFMAAAGALLGVLQFLVDTPEADVEVVASDLADRVLRMLGLPSGEAHRIARLALPTP